MWNVGVQIALNVLYPRLLARPVKQVIPRSEVAAGMCARYIFVMPRKNGHTMRNVCGHGAGSTVDFIRHKPFFASYIKRMVHDSRISSV